QNHSGFRGARRFLVARMAAVDFLFRGTCLAAQAHPPMDHHAANPGVVFGMAAFWLDSACDVDGLRVALRRAYRALSLADLCGNPYRHGRDLETCLSSATGRGLGLARHRAGRTTSR